MKTWQIVLLVLGGFAVVGLLGLSALFVTGFFQTTAPTPVAQPVSAPLPTQPPPPAAKAPTSTTASVSAAPATEINLPTPRNTNTPLPTDTALPSLTPITYSANGTGQATQSISCIPSTTYEQGTVTNVIDAANIEVLVNGQTLRVRYIGIAAPAQQPYADKAALLNRTRVFGQSVRLYSDQQDKDQNGNLLRYVVRGPIFVNYDLVLRGLALTQKEAPGTACASYFDEAQAKAQQTRAGMWTQATTLQAPAATLSASPIP